MRKILILLLIIPGSNLLHAQATFKTKNIILITIDGLRWQEVYNGADSSFLHNNNLVEKRQLFDTKYWNNNLADRRNLLLPFFWQTLAVKGQLYGNRQRNSFVNVRNPYWFSYPGYNEILTGYADERINSNEFGPNPNLNVFEFISNHSKEFQGKIAVFTSWDAFNDILNEKRSHIQVSAGFEKLTERVSEKMDLLNKIQNELPDIFGGVRLDGVTYNMGFEYLKTRKPRILYLAFDETDDFAHGRKYDQYLNSAHYTDGFLQEIWQWIQSDPDYKDKTTMLVTTDHGRGESFEGWKSHGTDTPHSNETWFAVIGPDTPAKGEITNGQYYNNQYANTIATLLGFKYENAVPIGEPIPQVLGKK